MDYDVIVVGCGIAGMSAAVTAAQKGAKVGVLERSTKEERGGNSRYTESFLRMKNDREISDDFEDMLAKFSMGTIDPALLKLTTRSYDQWPPALKAYPFTDPELISSFAEGVPEAIAWLKSFGLKFPEDQPFLTTVTQRCAPVGGGEALVETLADAADKLKNVNFLYETTARSLIQNKKGEVIGLRAWSNTEGIEDLESKAVILACGGFEGNMEMMTRYIGKHAYLARPTSPGGQNNKGEGIEMSLAIGAAPAGQYDAFHAEPIDPRSGRSEALVLIFMYGILVNQLGERFIDEASGPSDLIYEDITRAILMQPGGKAYTIYDSKIEDVPNYRVMVRTDREPIKAKSIKELALELEIEPSRLEKTIKTYNESVQEGNFDPLNLDSKCTKGIEPPKSNWARIIDETDLMAFPTAVANVFTFGGLKVTPKAQVINRDGYIIPGLFAAGETVGMYYRSYVGSTSCLKAMVFGRKAGEGAVNIARK